MIKKMLPTPPKPQFSSIFDLFWTSFGHVFDLKSIYVRTRIESNDPMFKLHKEKKVTTLCSNRVGVARRQQNQTARITIPTTTIVFVGPAGLPKGLQYGRKNNACVRTRGAPQIGFRSSQQHLQPG